MRHIQPVVALGFYMLILLLILLLAHFGFYLSKTTAYTLMSIFGRVCASCCEKGKGKSMTMSLETDDRLKSRSTKMCHKNRFHGRIHLKKTGVGGVSSVCQPNWCSDEVPLVILA